MFLIAGVIPMHVYMQLRRQAGFLLNMDKKVVVIHTLGDVSILV